LRNNQSEKALHHLLSTDPPLVFIDVNLRSPWWRKESVREMLRQAHWAKLNTEELDLLYPSDKETRQQLTDFISEYDLQGAVLTHAEKGAELLTSDNEHYSVQPSNSLIITDTVGAGDAFTSVVITGLNNNWPLSATIQRAQQFASAIVQQRGAIVNNPAFYLDFLKDWELI
jgi:fructokinase